MSLKQMQALDTASEVKQEPVAHSVIAGAIFDFMGWLTSRKERIVLSSADNASPAVEAITEFAKMRNLSLDDAKVQDWNTTPPQPEQEPVAWLHTKIEGVAVPHRPADLDKHPDRWEALYKTPPPCPTCEALARTVMLDQIYHEAQRKPLTPREVELIDGMIEVQLRHAAQCDGIANRTMAEKQKSWDMERVELLRKLKAAHGIKENT